MGALVVDGDGDSEVSEGWREDSGAEESEKARPETEGEETRLEAEDDGRDGGPSTHGRQGGGNEDERGAGSLGEAGASPRDAVPRGEAAEADPAAFGGTGGASHGGDGSGGRATGRGVWEGRLGQLDPADSPELPVRAWLSPLGLAHYAPLFESLGLPAWSLRLLEEADLREIGVATVGARRRILLAARAEARPEAARRFRAAEPAAAAAGGGGGGGGRDLPTTADLAVAPSATAAVPPGSPVASPAAARGRVPLASPPLPSAPPLPGAAAAPIRPFLSVRAAPQPRPIRPAAGAAGTLLQFFPLWSGRWGVGGRGENASPNDGRGGDAPAAGTGADEGASARAGKRLRSGGGEGGATRGARPAPPGVAGRGGARAGTVPPAAPGAPGRSRSPPVPLRFSQLVPGFPEFVVDRFDRLPPSEHSYWVLTHFHADHYKGLSGTFRRGLVVCTPPTAALARLKLRVEPRRILEVPFHRPTRLGSAVLTFLPANHCPGAAMVLFEDPEGPGGGESEAGDPAGGDITVGVPGTLAARAIGGAAASTAGGSGALGRRPQAGCSPGAGSGYLMEVDPEAEGEGAGSDASAFLPSPSLASPVRGPPPLTPAARPPPRPKRRRLVLHTGDCRAEGAQMKGDPVLSHLASREVAGSHLTLVLDTTYCSPEHDFPTQSEVLEYVGEAALAEARNEPASLFLFGTYTIGKERVFLEAARKLGRKVCVAKDKLAVLERVGLDADDLALLTTDERSTNLHAVPMRMLAQEAMRQLLKQAGGRFKQCVAFRPTGWTFGADRGPGAGEAGAGEARANAAGSSRPGVARTKADRQLALAGGQMAGSRSSSTRKLGRKARRGVITTYSLPYSEHSSFSELCDFVAWLRPDTLVPAVNADDGGPKSARLVRLLRAGREP